MKKYDELSIEYKNEFFVTGDINYFLIALEMSKISRLQEQIKQNDANKNVNVNNEEDLSI